MDLKSILLSAIEKYGKNNDYPIPDIIWTETNMAASFGEYRYSTNTIYISRLLNSRQISYEALESVVYHEYSHQVFSDEEDNEKYLISKVPRYIEHQKELETFFANYNAWTEGKHNDLIMLQDDDTVLCEVVFDAVYPDLYFENLDCYNHCYLGKLEINKNCKFSGTHKQVIFLVKGNGEYFICGWAKNVKLHSPIQNIDLSRFDIKYPDCLQYNFKCLRDNARWVNPLDCEMIESISNIQKLIKKNGYCMLSEITKEQSDFILNCINNFDYSFASKGFSDESVSHLSPIITESEDTILEVVKSEKSNFRKIFLMNKAIAINPSVGNYEKRADIFEEITLLDYAADDYKKCSLLGMKKTSFGKDPSKYSDELLKAHKYYCEQ